MSRQPGVRIGRFGLSLVAVCAIGAAACSHPGGTGGTPGSAGSTGTAGTSGNAGTSGSAGTTGGAGTTGSGGDISTGGNSGTAGTGDTGTAGTTGSAGTSGSAGASGTAGSTGSAGTSGAAGTSGSAGATGAAGTTGSAGATGTGGSPGNNLITNGDFSAGAANWHTQDGSGNVNGSGAYCVSNPGAALIGWESTPGSPLMLSMGRSYRLSYQASGSGTVNVKVGLAVAPYTADFEGNNGINSSLQSFTHTFTSPNNDVNTGVAFTFANAGSSTVCIDNVTLVAN